MFSGEGVVITESRWREYPTIKAAFGAALRATHLDSGFLGVCL